MQGENQLMDAKSVVPLDVQLQAICATRLSTAWELLAPYIPELNEWNPKRDSQEIIRQIIRDHLSFTDTDLIAYLRLHPNECRDLLHDSYNKHYSPATFIEEVEGGQYHVGWAGHGREQVHVFSTLAEATADYVLFNWGLPRLHHE